MGDRSAPSAGDILLGAPIPRAGGRRASQHVASEGARVAFHQRATPTPAHPATTWGDLERRFHGAWLDDPLASWHNDTCYTDYYTESRMALNIRNPEVEALAAKLARLTGESKTHAVSVALRQRLERLHLARAGRSLANELDEIAKHCASLPRLDTRSDDEIMGYDEHGLPG